jgi:hypothetical protein
MIAKLRRVLIAAKYRPGHSGGPTPQKPAPSGWHGTEPRYNHESRETRPAGDDQSSRNTGGITPYE